MAWFAHHIVLIAAGVLLSGGAAPKDRSAASIAAKRERMVEAITAMARTADAPSLRRIDPAVLGVMRAVPRHRLVPPEQEDDAYDNRPLPIGQGQTISQPYIVALMTHLLAPRPDHVVLEVGTGSGYQAAVLSRLVRRVYTIEIVTPLARTAAARLAELGYRNVVVRHGDGYAGWAEHAPFDGIIVTAGAEEIPKPLLAQLKRGGRLVIPLGPSGDQQLVLVRKGKDGRLSRDVVLPVRFVPFTRDRTGGD